MPLVESLNLKAPLSGIANPKSSTGRLDVFTRLIADRGVVFDQVPAGYSGPLYAEISPRTFSIVVRSGDRLNQLRVRRHTGLIDLGLIGHYHALDFWEPVVPNGEGTVILNPGDFYIFSSKEAVAVPPDHAAEMRAHDTRVGEFRVHYAGFFDPGFGFRETGGAGSKAVLEIRPFEVPFALRDGQLVGRLVYERLTAVPDKLYGVGIGSSYQCQGLALAKQFMAPHV